MTLSLSQSLGPNHTPLGWAIDWLTRMTCPLSQSNLQVVYSWEFAESGGGGGMYNPLNTTQPWANTTDYNSSGVKNYASYQDGLDATYTVIQDPQYQQIVNQLKQGNSTWGLVSAITNSIWGTKNIPLMTLPILETEMQVVPSPHPPILAGRTATAIWNPAVPNQVRLENGARLKGDVPTSTPGVYTWSPPIPPGCFGIGISLSIHTSGTLKGTPDGLGILLYDDHQDTYNGYWA